MVIIEQYDNYLIYSNVIIILNPSLAFSRFYKMFDYPTFLLIVCISVFTLIEIKYESLKLVLFNIFNVKIFNYEHKHHYKNLENQ